MKTNSRSKTQGRRWTDPAATVHCVLGAALLLGPGLACADEEEDMTRFEGGEEAYDNWVDLSVGSLFTENGKAQAEQARRRSAGPFGGVEDFHYHHETEEFTRFSADGRALFDQNDYKLSLGLKQEELYFIRFNVRNVRTWSNGNGGFYPPNEAWFPLGDDALSLDHGEISFEAGLALENLPSVTFKYSHLYRDGQKGSTSWGQTHPLFTTLTRGLSPAFYDLEETRDIFKLDAEHEIKDTKVGLGLRYETGDLDNARKISQWPGESAIERKITNREGVSYDLFNVHAFSETWIKPDLLFSTGFMFANLDNNISGSRIYGSDFDVSYNPNVLNGQGYNNLDGSSQMREYVLNLNLMATPLKHLTIVPSVRVQREDWNADSTAIPTSGTTVGGPLLSNSDGDTLDVRERIDVRYTGITNWVLYAQSEWTQGEGNIEENGGIGLGSPIQRETEDRRRFQKYKAGCRWYAARGVTTDVGGYYKKNAYDYDHETDNTSNSGANRYPAYLVMQDFETYDGYARLTLRPLPNITLVSRYEYQLSTIRTQPDAVSGLGDVESSEMTSHIIAQNVSWSPWARLYLQVGFDYVLSETKTPTSDYTQAILDSQNNYWTVHFNSGLVLDDKTDLNLGYSHYRADNYTDNSAVGLPYGSGSEDHSVTATVVRRITDKLRLTLRYGYFNSRDEPSGGFNNYEAHALFSSLRYRF